MTLTTPAELVPLGASRDAHHVYGWNDGRKVYHPVPSVTTILKVVDKSGPLVGWAKRETARCAVDNLETVSTIKSTAGRQAAIDYLKGIPDYQRDTAADLGTTIHLLTEKLSKGEAITVTDEAKPYIEGYLRWIGRVKPEFLALEEMVFALKQGYAGTVDAIARIAGETWYLDNKTGSGVYAETGLQLAAYAGGEFIGRTEDRKRYALPKAERYGVVHIRPEGTRLIEYRVTAATFNAFIRARDLYAWQQGEAKQVVGREVHGEEQAA